MRLLRRDALDRLILTDFYGKLIPPYAILSHQWGDSETLTEDVSNGTYKEKEKGYQKLRFCAEQVARDASTTKRKECSSGLTVCRTSDCLRTSVPCIHTTQ
jgi:hypothetical protein